MNSNKKKTSGVAITFYTISVILLVVFAFTIYYSYTTIAAYMEGYQMTFADEWQMFVSSYIQACLPAFVGAVVCYGIATILVKMENTQNALLACIEEASANTVEESDFEDEFEETAAPTIEDVKSEIENTVTEDENA